MVGHVARAVAPTALAAAAIVAERLVFGYGNPFSPARAVVELIAFVVLAAALTWRLEGALLREAVGYLRRARSRV
jgi:ABC-type thiamin/hydroxymethylpyrimidine transport system permease subunit